MNYRTLKPTAISPRAGGAVAEWSKALLEREKIDENQKIPGSPPGLGTFKKRIKTKFRLKFSSTDI